LFSLKGGVNHVLRFGSRHLVLVVITASESQSGHHQNRCQKVFSVMSHLDCFIVMAQIYEEKNDISAFFLKKV
jgi:hypothetical protein